MQDIKKKPFHIPVLKSHFPVSFDFSSRKPEIRNSISLLIYTTLVFSDTTVLPFDVFLPIPHLQIGSIPSLQITC